MTNLTITATGLKELRASLKDFSDRRFNAACATALTRTARVIQQDWKTELSGRVDRPTTLTQNAPLVQQATAQSLVAVVRLRDQISNGAPPAQYLQPLEYGGRREHKVFERALIAQGSMPAGSYAIPTEYAARDAYGNVTRGQIVQILVQLAGGSVREGYRRVISTSAVKRAKAAIRSGRDYIAVLQQQGKLYPGIYARVDGGMRMVFSFERRVYYKRQLSLMDRAKSKAEVTLRAEMRRAIVESAARLAAK